MGWLQDIGKGSVEEAHATFNDLLKRAEPLLNNLFTRVQFLVHDVLDRFTIDIKIKLNPVRPREVNPIPDESK